MSWLDRVKTEFKLTSPDGKEFNALWSGDSRGNEKVIGFFKYPKIRGIVGQDLDVKGDRYPTVIFFEGEDHDLVAARFFKACRDRGKWDIIHPVHGELTLQLITYNQSVAPVENGNISQFDLEFIDTLDPSVLTTPVELGSIINNQIEALNNTAASQYLDNLKTDSASVLLANETAVNKVVTASDLSFANLKSKNASIASQISSIKRGITDTLEADSLDVLSLAGQVQQLIQLPSLAVADVRSRVAAYNDFANRILGISPTGNTPEDYNSALAQELALMAALAGMGLSIVGELQTRSQVIEIVDNFSDLFMSITDNLDLSQSNFLDVSIDNQYFSQSQSFNDATLLTAQSLQYLLVSSLDLAIEKIFKLEKDRAPIEITLSEYGSTLGSIDSDLDLFIQSNELKNDKIRILRAGREVVVYV